MSSLLLVCTKCKRKFKDRRSLTQHHRKSTTCRSQTALSVDVNLANNQEPLPPDLLAFSRVNLTKHRQALAKNPPAKADLARQQPQSNKTGVAKTTGLQSSLETSIEDDDKFTSKLEAGVVRIDRGASFLHATSDLFFQCGG